MFLVQIRGLSLVQNSWIVFGSKFVDCLWFKIANSFCKEMAKSFLVPKCFYRIGFAKKSNSDSQF